MTTAERTRTSLRRRTMDLQVVDRGTGRALRVWPHDGRSFVAGQPGARYSLRVTNHTDGRVLVVMSVDGVNIITGETAGYGQRGYVLGPYQSYDMSGWRKSETEVAAFTFAALPQSYAARTGRPVDVGVIGIAAFKERVVAPVPAQAASEARPRSDARSDISDLVVTAQRAPSLAAASPPPAGRMAPSMRSAPSAPSGSTTAPSEAVVAAERRAEKLGTAHGAREWSVSYTVPFERATAYPQLIRRIEYDTYENLVASGVIRPSWEAGHRPRPFPSSGEGAGYAPDPPGWP